MRKYQSASSCRHRACVGTAGGIEASRARHAGMRQAVLFQSKHMSISGPSLFGHNLIITYGLRAFPIDETISSLYSIGHCTKKPFFSLQNFLRYTT